MLILDDDSLGKGYKSPAEQGAGKVIGRKLK